MTQTTPDDETALLLETLGNQRRHVLGILEGLSEEDLRRPVLPSGWSCAELVQHLALDVEHWWFWRVVAGWPADRGEGVEDAWKLAPDVPAATVLDLCHAGHLDAARELIDGRTWFVLAR